MPDANGIFTLVPTYKATPGQTIGVNQHNPVLEDIGAALNRRMMRDGSTAMTGPLPMGGNRVTNIAQGSASTDAARMDQVVPYTASMASFANLSVAVNEIAYGSGVNVWAKTALTPWARTLLDDASADAALSTLGIPKLSNEEWMAGVSGQYGVMRPVDLELASTATAMDVVNAYTVGRSQSLQDVTAQRGFGGTYTNNTTRPIMVYIHVLTNGGDMSVLINGYPAMVFQLTGTNRYSTSFMVPVGFTYGVTGIAALQRWCEVR